MGYNIFMPMASVDTALHTGEEAKIYTYLNVREDAMQLFGFLTKDDLNTFKLLLSVNGIGPKAALGVLSGLSADELRFAVLADDVKTISKAPGIGKKTAQKLMLEFKDKLDLERYGGPVRYAERSGRGVDCPGIFRRRCPAGCEKSGTYSRYERRGAFKGSFEKYVLRGGECQGKENYYYRRHGRGFADRRQSASEVSF